MKNFTISIEETVVEEFEIYAENENEALEKAFQKYKNHEIILENGEVQYAQMAIVNPVNSEIKWIEI